FAGTGTVRLGRTETHVVFQAGPWTLFLPICKDGRFPPFAQVIPTPEQVKTTWQLSATDAAFLVETLPHLPGAKEESAPVTVELGETVCVRAKEADQPQVTEVVLPGSHATGPPMRCVLDRTLLRRAVELGLHTFQFQAPDKPVLAQDATRQFVA